MYNRMICFSFTLLVIFFNPRMAEREAHTRHFCPHTHILLCVSGQASLFTQGQEKSLRKAKGSLGPLSWLSMALPCHFLSSIRVLPRNSSMSLEFWLFFSLGNVPFTEPILRSWCSLRSCLARTFLLIQAFHLPRSLSLLPHAGNNSVRSYCGERGSNLTPYVFLYQKSWDPYFAFLNYEPSSISHPSEG